MATDIMKKRFLKFLVGLFVLLVTAGCGDMKPHPVSWEDIARTIPSNPDFVVSVNTDFEADSALNDIWGSPDVLGLIGEGLALDSVKPSHFVVVGVSNVTYVTWPLPAPRRIAKKVEDWPLASLNNTVDGHVVVRGGASLVLSSTQAWVVNNTYGEDYVNQLLSSAMNTKALHVQPFADCITTVPGAFNAVLPFKDKYYFIEVNHESGQMRIDVDAYDKLNRRVDVVEGLGRLPVDDIDEISGTSPFAAIAVERGMLPSVAMRLAKLAGNPKMVAAARLCSGIFENAEGNVVFHWDDDELSVNIPYATDDAAHIAVHRMRELLKKVGVKMEVEQYHSVMRLDYKIHYDLPAIDFDRNTPHSHTQTANPSAVAYARMDLSRNDPVVVYFELAPTHARLQVDFKENPSNLARVTQLLKTLVLRTF